VLCHSENVEYLYDANGNMTKDIYKGFTKIQYNILNLPEKININGKEILYVYSAAGGKLQNLVDGKSNPHMNPYYKDGIRKKNNEI